MGDTTEGGMAESAAAQVKRWRGAAEALLRALEAADPDPTGLERLLRETEAAYLAVRRRAGDRAANGAFQAEEMPEVHALLAVQTRCMERARQVRAVAAAKIAELQAKRDAARGYRRAMGGGAAADPGFYDRRV